MVTSLLLAAALFAGAAKPLPPPPSDYVHNEGVIGPEDERSLSQRLAEIERTTKAQFVVAIFQSLDGEDVDDYTNTLFRYWKIGDARRNDGVLFAMYVQDRKWRVEVGYGLEGKITDAAAGQIARNEGVPYFQRIAYYAGARAVVDALHDRLVGKTAAGPRRAQPIYPPPAFVLHPASGLVIAFLFQILLVIFLARKGGRTGGYSSSSSGSSYSSYSSSSSSSSGGGYSGGGGSSGGGGASGGW